MDWIPVVGAVGAILAAFIGATVGGFLQHKWVEKYRRPVLNIVDQDFVSEGGYRYHRIRVKNTGKNAAKNCIGKVTLKNMLKDDLLSDFQVMEGTQPNIILSEEVFSSIREESICWSRIGNPESIIINRDDTQTLDVYRAFSDSFFELPTERGWGVQRVRLNATKEYSGEIFVTSENAQTVRTRFKLVPDTERKDVRLVILS